MPSEHEFTKGRNPLLKDADYLWSAPSSPGAEIEVSNFVYSLVRLLKPLTIIETGCFNGDTTVKIIKAINKNKCGTVYFCDIDATSILGTIKRIEEKFDFDHRPFRYAIKPGYKLIQEMKIPIDFAFVDSSGDGKIRRLEVDALIPKMSQFGIIAVHDTAPHHFSIHTAMADMPLNRIYMNSPRGLSLYQA